ncbi:uncharacterized protein LOC128959905 [Oppia nitens]|uniref:uncharacterized protein LOC128959905 n=1 Tax=Oppia nitens TaxID=1686743 RepID=UPI0023DC2125|nr:uncharacterized protein LOC128959905 [Oppia nitens]
MLYSSRVNRNVKHHSKPYVCPNTFKKIMTPDGCVYIDTEVISDAQLKQLDTCPRVLLTRVKDNEDEDDDSEDVMSEILGLPNLGNTCFINVIIQVLRVTPGFRQFVCKLNKQFGHKLDDTNQMKLTSCLHQIFVKFRQNEVNCCKKVIPSDNKELMKSFINICQSLTNRFEPELQHDCHEFIDWLVNEQLNRYASIRFDRFDGTLATNRMCSKCQISVALPDELFADIKIPTYVTSDDYRRISCGRQMPTFSDVVHRKYVQKIKSFCKKCLTMTTFSTMNSIKVAPNVLIMFLETLPDFGHKSKRKSNTSKKLFTLPFHLKYSTINEEIQYSLYGIIMHSGLHNNGHYYAVINSSQDVLATKPSDNCLCDENVLSDSSWIKVSDEDVIEVNEDYVQQLLDSKSTLRLGFYRQI